jgi:HEAT repeat protein
MKKPLLIGCGLVWSCLVGFVAWEVLHAHEPVYGGKPLGAWLEQFSTNHFAHGRGSVADREAQEAIRQIGTNAIPVFLRLITAKESALKERMLAYLPKPWQSRLRGRSAYAYQTLGAYGFVALGPIAEPAVPVLMDLARSKDKKIRGHAVYALGHLGSAARPAVPLLIECLDDPEGTIRSDAMDGLASICLEPSVVVPVFIRYAGDPERGHALRYTAIQGLGLLGAQAKAAVPTLLRLLDDPDADIRLAVTNYLPMVDPVAAGALRRAE